MKNICVLLLCLVTIYDSFGQCNNGTNTNPVSPAPLQAGFKTNSFDWRQNPIPVTGKANLNRPTIQNPFFSNENYLRPLHDGLNSDSKPEDGWELIKQDFGYAELNGFWNGTTIFNRIGYNKPAIAYMMLYNRYSTTLRIITNLYLANTANASQIVAKIQLVEGSNNLLNYANLNFAALFNQYNRVQTALDQRTKITEVTAPMQVQATHENFTFADFKLSYDPCICFFESAFQVEFETKAISTLKLEGRILGNSVDIADKNAKPENDFLTSVWNKKIPDQPYNQIFYSETMLQQRLKEASNAATAPSSIDPFSYIKYGAKLAKIGKEVKLQSVIDFSKKVIPYLDFASFLIDLIPKEPVIQRPTIITADLAATGTITSNVTLNGQEIIMGVPGSKNSGLLPEYAASNSKGTKPMYPMYNEIPGHFAVLRTPTIHFNYQIHEVEQPNDVAKISYILKLPDNQDLSYALGSLVNVPKTQIFVGIEVKKNAAVNYVSSFLPLNQSKNLYALFETTTTGLWQPNDLGIMGGPFDAADIKLVFQLFYDFKPDASGNTKAGYDLIKVKVNPVLDVAHTYQNDPRFLVYANAPTDLTIGETNVANGNTLFSFGDIRISGNITNTGSTPLIIIAQGEVNIDPNVQLTGNIEIRSNQLFPPGITPVIAPNPPLTASAIQTFCQKSEYKAKEGLPTVREPESEVSQTGSNRLNSAFVVSPNPFQDELRVRLELSETDFVKLWLANGLGQVVQMGLEETREKGVYEETLRTNDLAPGVYYLTLQTKRGVETKKMVKQL